MTYQALFIAEVSYFGTKVQTPEGIIQLNAYAQCEYQQYSKNESERDFLSLLLLFLLLLVVVGGRGGGGDGSVPYYAHGSKVILLFVQTS